MRKSLIALMVAAPVALAGCAGNVGEHGTWNDWNYKCITEERGTVSITHRGFWSDRYECIRDGEIITVPGYEGF